MTATPRSVSATTQDGLTATFSENTATVPVGGSVTYTLTLTNNTSQAITYQPSAAGDSLGAVGGAIGIYNSSQQLVYPGATTPADVTAPVNITLAPGQSSSITTTSGFAFTPAGIYHATATYDIFSTSGEAEGVTTGPLTVTAQ